MCDFLKHWSKQELCWSKVPVVKKKKVDCCGATLVGTFNFEQTLSSCLTINAIPLNGGCVGVTGLMSNAAAQADGAKDTLPTKVEPTPSGVASTFFCRDRNIQQVIVYLSSGSPSTDLLTLRLGTSCPPSDDCDLSQELRLNESVAFQLCETECDTSGEYTLTLEQPEGSKVLNSISALIQVVCGPPKCPGYKSHCLCCSSLYVPQKQTIVASVDATVPTTLLLDPLSGIDCTCVVDDGKSVKVKEGDLGCVVVSLVLETKEMVTGGIVTVCLVGTTKEGKRVEGEPVTVTDLNVPKALQLCDLVLKANKPAHHWSIEVKSTNEWTLDGKIEGLLIGSGSGIQVLSSTC